MSVQSFTPTIGLQATPEAIAHIRRQLQQNPDAEGFRLGVKRSGCSGFMYQVDLVETAGDSDHRFQVADDVSIFVDEESLPVINGTVIDFVKQGLNSVFRFNNPNMEDACGCGESFSIRDESETAEG